MNKLYTFSKIEHSDNAKYSTILQVIASNEQEARQLLLDDGWNGADSNAIYSLESCFGVKELSGNPHIPFSMQFDFSETR